MKAIQPSYLTAPSIQYKKKKKQNKKELVSYTENDPICWWR